MRRVLPFAFALFQLSALFSLPTGMKVEKGGAVLGKEEDAFWIESERDSLLSWDSFSIEKGEKVHFAQPSAESFLVNRVTGLEESRILGALTSNGEVYLLNPNGIFIGPDASISTAGFLASTFFCEEDPNGLWEFAGESEAPIVNLGKIDCPEGDVFLLAKRVESHGSILAHRGGAYLAAGVQMRLKPEGRGRVEIALSPEGEGEIWHTGAIEALSVDLQAAGNPYTYAIRQEGEIRSVSFAREGGKIVLRALEGAAKVGGTLAAEGESQGGAIDLFARDLFLDEAKISASGAAQGGKIRIGGDLHGQTAEGYLAETTILTESVSVAADAQREGDGGTIVVWGSKAMEAKGRLSAHGGAEGGDGGFIEVSSRGYLGIGRMGLDLSAPFGRAGELLIDPTDIVISLAADSGGSWSGGDPNTFTPSGTDNVINAVTLEGFLDVANVTISTASAEAQDGNVTFSNSAGDYTISWASGTNFVITADGRIVLDAGVRLESTSPSTFTSFDFTAGGGIQLSQVGASYASMYSEAGSLRLTGTGAVANGLPGIQIGNPAGVSDPATFLVGGTNFFRLIGTGGGDVGLPAEGVVIGQHANLVGIAAQMTITGTAVPADEATGVLIHNDARLVDGFTQGISVSGTSIVCGAAPSGGHTFETVDGDITISTSNQSPGGIELNGSSLRATGGGDIALISTAAFPVTAASISCKDHTRIRTNTGSVTMRGASVNLRGSGTIGFNPVTIDGSNDITIDALDGQLLLAGPSSLETGDSLSTGGGDIHLTATGGISFSEESTITGTATVVSNGGDINVNSALTINRPTSFSAGAGDINIASTLNGTRTFTVSSAATTTFTGAIGAVMPPGAFSITSTNIVQSSTAVIANSLTYTGAISLANNITTAAALVLNGTTTLTGSVELSVPLASSPITTGAISGGGNNLTITGGSGTRVLSSLSGIGTFTVNNSGAVTVSNAASATTVNLSGKSAGSSVTFGGAVAFTTLTTGSINHAIVFNGGGTITNATTFLNTGGVTIGGGTLNFLGGVNTSIGSTFIAGTVTTLNTPMTMGAVALTGTASLATTGGLLTLGAVSGAQSLSISTGAGAANIASLNTASFTVSSGAAITVAGTTVVPTVNLAGKSAGSNVTFQGAVTIGTLTTAATAYGIVFNGGGSVSNAATFLNTGDLIFPGPSFSFPGGMSAAAPTTQLTGTLSTSNTSLTLGELLLTGTASLNSSGGLITLGGTVNNNQALTINSGAGNTVFSGVVGGVTPLSSLAVTAAQISVGANISAQGGTLVFSGPVVLTADSVFTDTGTTGITFESTITGPYDLTITATQGDVAVSGAIDTSGTAGGDVAITSTLGSITVGAITTDGTAGDAGDITLQPTENFSSNVFVAGTQVPDGFLELRGPLSAVSTGGAGGAISLAPAGKSEGMSVATIYTPSSGGDLVIAGDTLTVGAFESITVFGDVQWDLAISARVGDVVATGALDITAPTIEILLHGSFPLLSYLGTLYDTENLHFLGLGAVALNGTQVPIGAGPSPDILTLTGLTLAQFEIELLFGSTVLGYDVNIPVPPPVIPVAAADVLAIYKFQIANSQVPFYLPRFPWKVFQRKPLYQECLDAHFFYRSLIENRAAFAWP